MSLRIIVAGLLLLLGIAHAPFAGAQTYDFSVTLSANDGAGLSPGDTVQLTVDVHNGGPNASTPSDLLVIDIPNVFSFNGAVSCLTYTEGTSGSNITFMWNQIPEGGGALAPGQDALCTIGLTLNSVPGGSATAVATLTPSTYQINSGNDSSNYTFNINPPPAITQALAAPVSGQNVTLTFGASNANTCVGSSTPAVTGWDSMTLCSSAVACASVSVPLTNLAPANYSFTATCTNPSGSVNSSTNATVVVNPPTFPQPLTAPVSGQNVTLAFGASNANSCVGLSTPAVTGWDSMTLCSSAVACANVSVPLTNLAPTTYSFTATCTNAGGSTNSSASATVGASVPTTDLSVQAIVTPGVITPGQAFVFNFTAQNLGAQDAPGAQVAVTTPSQIQIVSSTCSGLAAGSGAGIWNIGMLMANSTVTCTVQAKAIIAGQSIAEILTISFGGTDTNSSNDSAVVPLAIGAGTDLSINLTIADPARQYTVGESVSIAMTVADAAAAGDATAVTATFNVTNPSTLTGLTSDICGTVDTTGKLTWNIGNLAHGATKTCVLTGTIASASTAIPVSANVAPTQNDSSLGNNASNLVIQTYLPPVSESTTVSGAPTTEPSTHVSLSKDGSIAVFESQESDLVQINTNTSGQDIYSAGTGTGGNAVLETLDSQGHQLIGTSSLPAISGDGSIIAFAYAVGAAKQAKDAVTGQMFAGSSGQPKHQVDMGMAGAAPNGPVSGAPSVASANGSRKLVFCSAAFNLVANDTNGARDVFLVDPSNPAQATQRVSTDSSGTQLSGHSCEPKLSADGTKVVFTISAPSLYGNSNRQVVRKDLSTGALELISLSTVPARPGANADSSEPTINGDGSVIAFTSQASDLDSLGAPVGGREAFVSLAQSGAVGASRTIKRVRSGDGTIPNGLSQHPQLSNDGTTVVMQSAATNFFGAAKALTSSGCGAVAITTNFFTPALMGSALCNGQTSNQNPTISGDGTKTGFDSNAPQSGTSSNNSNTYSQGVGSNTATGVANLSGDFSGQWFDPNQNGQGLVIDVAQPGPNNVHYMSVTWFVYVNGQPTWVQGAAVPQAGSGDLAGKVVVQMDQVAIFKGKSFPLGEPSAMPSLWGSMTLTFADANTGSMSWTSSYPGFNSGTMPIKHFRSVGVPASDPPGAQIKACHSGNWKEPAKSGHGFEFEVSSGALSVDWFTFDPAGNPVWLYGGGPITGNTVAMPLGLIHGTGAQFPPKFDHANITDKPDWGTATFTFTDATHGHVTWNSTILGYGQGQIDIVPTYGLDRRTCQ